MSDEKARFPVLQGQSEVAEEAKRKRMPFPESIPLSLVVPHAAQAETNHGQTLRRLAERGGLCPSELWAVVHDMKYYEARRVVDEAKALQWVLGLDGVELRKWR